MRHDFNPLRPFTFSDTSSLMLYLAHILSLNQRFCKLANLRIFKIVPLSQIPEEFWHDHKRLKSFRDKIVDLLITRLTEARIFPDFDDVHCIIVDDTKSDGTEILEIDFSAHISVSTVENSQVKTQTPGLMTHESFDHNASSTNDIVSSRHVAMAKLLRKYNRGHTATVMSFVGLPSLPVKGTSDAWWTANGRKTMRKSLTASAAYYFEGLQYIANHGTNGKLRRDDVPPTAYVKMGGKNQVLTSTI
tara:strand:+ start:280 stop:1020 length:741 start_codon:yes stop_codon:yes gene_type:complete